MKTFSEKAIDEFKEKFTVRFSDGRIHFIKPDMDVLAIISFFQSKLSEQEAELAVKLEKACGLELKDLPAFPPKDIDLFDLILKIGVEKIKREQREEILKSLPKEKKYFKVEDEGDLEMNSETTGFNEALAKIIEIIEKI